MGGSSGRSALLLGANRSPTFVLSRCTLFLDGLAPRYHWPSLANVFRRLAGYVDQILKGEKPGEIPIYLASTFELLLNLKSAKTLGLTVSQALIARADVIE